MSIINGLNKNFKIDASGNASCEKEIDELIRFAAIEVPDEYLELIKEQAEIEISICNQKYIRIWSAIGCVEMNEAYHIQRYIPKSLVIGDDEEGNAILYAEGKNGFGVYMVAFNDLDIDEMTFISQTLKDLLVSASGIEKILYT